MRILYAVSLSTIIAFSAAAQTGTVAGTVARDTVGNMVARAEVQLPQLNRITLSNAAGEFQFNDVPAGRYGVTVRAVGYELFVDSIDVAPGNRVDADLFLSPVAVSLETQHTSAPAVVKRLPPGLDEMADRMKQHIGGHFFPDSVLRANDQRKLTYFFASVPGVRQILGGVTGTEIFLQSARYPPQDACYIDIYMNGASYFRGPATANNPQVDMSAFTAMDFSGIEFYPSGANVPPQYNMTRGAHGHDCGVILLWTRR